jgi:archaemetzincin
MELPTVTIVTFSHFGKEFPEKIAEVVQHELRCRVEIKEKHLDLSEFFDPGRRQYNGDRLLRTVDSMDFSGSAKVIAIFNIDLYIPILTYIFGQAQLGGRTAIASLFRLSNDRYGIASDESYLLSRFQKEVIHELGHLFGLIHCHTPTCVMRSSTYVEDIDQKDVVLCPKCRTQLKFE